MVLDSASANPVEAQLSNIARSGSLNMVGAMAAAIGNFVLVVVVTQEFDQSSAGILFTATSVFLILLGIATLGTEGGLARFMLRFEAMGRAADIPTCLRAARRSILLVSVVLAAVTILLADWLAAVIGLTTPDGPPILITLAVLLPLAALGDFSLAGARAFGTVRSTVILDKVLRPTLQPLGAWAVAAFGGGIIALTASWVIPYALAGGLSLYVFHRLLGRRGHLPRGAVTNRAAVRREFWSFTWPRGIARLCQIILQRADIVLIAGLLSVREAAIYTAATRFVPLGQFGVHAIQQVLQPRFSQMLSMGQDNAAGRIFKIATTWSMAVAWPLYMITAAASGLYLQIFGSDYVAAGSITVVVLMSGAMLFSVAAGPLDTMLLMAGRSKTSLWISLTVLAVNLLLCLLLIPIWGIAGAAVAWAVSVVIKNAATFTSVKLLLSMTPFSKGSALVAAANVGCFALPFLAVTFLDPPTLWIIAGIFLAGLAAYAGLLWLWREQLELSAFRALRRKTTTTLGERRS